MLTTILFGFYVYLGGAVLYGVAHELYRLNEEVQREKRHQACFERLNKWSLAKSLS